ncbi:MAG: diguanylate cyclase (GGDEF)-like protein [Candidatus Endobugula sp.]|jgi:diguanylate cyclase (GGDEF)-like protein
MDDYDSLPCGVFITDQRCNIHYCNSRFVSSVFFSIDEIVGCNLDTLLTNASKILFQQIVLPSIINQGPIDEVQLNFLGADNRKLPMVVFAKRDEVDNNRIFWCCYYAVERDKLINALKQSQCRLEETNAQLKILSKTDELTGCYNRREMLLKLRMVRRQMERSQSSFALLMLDLDFFKKVNDVHGHTEGDYVLKQFAHLLKANARFADVVARFGGEEFILILPQADAASAMITANRIHDNMKKIRSKAGVITVSIGIFVAPFDVNISDADIIGLADNALYASKDAGRNRTTLETSFDNVKKSLR